MRPATSTSPTLRNHRVRKVTPDGVISTVAGNGTSGFSGDGGPATSAQLGVPVWRCSGCGRQPLHRRHLNHRIRKVTVDGVISTVAGDGRVGFGGDGGPATSAQINGPFGRCARCGRQPLHRRCITTRASAR